MDTSKAAGVEGDESVFTEQSTSRIDLRNGVEDWDAEREGILTASTRTWVNVSQHYVRTEFLRATTYECAPCAARHDIFANSGTEGGSVMPQDA